MPALVGADQHHLSGLGLPTTLPEGSDKFEIVGEVLRDMPNATVTDQTEEIRARFIKKKNLGESWKTAERALKLYRDTVGARKPCSVMLS